MTAFDRFWAVYPRRVAKGAARKSFDRACKLVGGDEKEIERIIDAAAVFAASRKGEDMKFTPHASTWLNQERWDDDPACLGGEQQTIDFGTIAGRITGEAS